MSLTLDREFDFTVRDFERIRKLIHGRAGIALADSKEEMVYSRIARRLRSLGLDSFGDYLDRLERGGDADEWQAFTNALTTNLTSFFREAHHFDVLRELLAQRPRGHRARIWCAAASTGEEPYSLAITACEAHATLAPPVDILATDIDTQVLATAERGVYPVERIDKLSESRRKRFFLKGKGSAEGLCRVAPPLRELLTFRPLNLLDAAYPMRGPFDAIFCRNVMIYFDKPTQLAVLQRMVPLLARDGLLFAGHSESFFHAGDLIRPVGRTIYRRADA
ncbi:MULTISPECIES: CheR family methyltransferase [Hydrocarboniphaga]|jgi:chemotaxis protein methyltransferase CheR|uniref:CheR family methyltransferase n=1 Tax=Hydrocarboniphaga TaxID=243627 RepID=UPI002ABC5521|nr:CheR family methyltransferase [Hydrocarboniphaga sp.]MDZ4077918.1 CheR family methyltransferase [Hydrocarboniphaga sp.]